MKIKYPANVKTPEEKTKVLYRLQELLKQEHNNVGKKLKKGQLSKTEWKKYLNTFNKKSDAIIEEILNQREEMKKNDDPSISLSYNIIEE